MPAGPAQTIGRLPELEQLDEALDALAGGEPAFLAVEGEAGIGKTRMLDELRQRAEARGHIVLAGSAAEFEREVPFGIWVNALDSYVAAQVEDLEQEGDAALLGELAGVLPSVRTAIRDQGPELPDERYRAHRAVQRLLERLAEGSPVVVVLDDLHWSDGASIELIAALLRRGPAAPVLLALGFRSGRAAERRLAAALAVPTLLRMELGQLSEKEAAELLTDVDPRSRAAIYDHGGGNPFYLEALRRASDEGRLGAVLESNGNGSGAGGDVPAAVAASLAEELTSLLPAVRVLLDGAAVAGEPFEPDLAAAIAEVSEADGLDALDVLLEADLVRPTDVPRRFGFRHPLVRQAVYESTRGGWRLAAHARAAAALESRGAGAPERAHHVEQSAGQGDQEAIDLLVEAGRATAARAPAAAARWFGAALRLLPAADRTRQADLRVARASALRSLGDLEQSRDLLLEAIDLLPADDRARRVELTTLCATVEHWLGRHDEAHQRLTAAWDDLPDRDSAAAAALQVELAADGLHEFDFARALEMGAQALERARSLGDTPLIAAAAAALALGEAAEGKIAAAREHRDEAVAAVDALSDGELAPRLEALYYLAWTENYLEGYAESLRHADRGITIARAHGEGRLLIPMMLTKGYPFELEGRLGEARELCESAVEAARLSGNPHFLFWALFELGWAHYYIGDFQAALAACEESAQVGGRLAGGAMPAAGGGPGWPLAATLFEIGEHERGFGVMAEMGSDELEHAIPVERCFYWETLTIAELARDRPEAAEAFARRAEEHAAGLDLEIPAAVARRARAAVLLAAGDAAEAVVVAKEAAAGCAKVGAALQGAFATSIMGRALAASDDRKAAVAALREAEGVFDICGAVRMRDETRRELRKLGARAEKRGPAKPEDFGIPSLTDREAGIADLVTERKTNKEIAAELFLSEKTIESHLRNIFVKLGASSRVEVARAIERDRHARGEQAGSP